MLKANHPKEMDDHCPIKQIVPFDNGLVVVFSHYIKCYRLSDHDGWQCVFESEYIANQITMVDFYFESSVSMRCILAICDCEKEIILWSTRRLFPYLLNNNNNQSASNSLLCRSRNIFFRMDEIEEIGRFHLNDYPIDSMFFIGCQFGMAAGSCCIE